MPRRKIPLEINEIYHVYNRGFRKKKIFYNQEDYERFLYKFLKYKDEYNIDIISWSLMPNHFHMILRQPEVCLNNEDEPVNISNFLRRLQQSHAMYLKNKYEKDGMIFQGRFKAKYVYDDAYLIQLIHYIHRQPSHHNISTDFDWPYSSLDTYMQRGESNIFKNIIFLDKNLLNIKKYPEMFKEFKSDKLKVDVEDFLN